MRSTSLVLTSVALLLACDSDPTGLTRDEEAPLQTDRLLYALERDVWQLPEGFVAHFQTTIDYRYRNPTERTIYIVKCRTVSFQLQKLDGTGKWSDVWAGPDYERCLGPPTVIPARGEASGTLEIAGFEPNTHVLPCFSTAELAGVHRLVLLSAVYLDDPADYPDGAPVEFDHLYSNQFKLEVH